MELKARNENKENGKDERIEGEGENLDRDPRTEEEDKQDDVEEKKSGKAPQRDNPQ